MENYDRKTVDGFGDEWTRYDQSQLTATEHSELFDRYFGIFPWDELPADSVGFDLGCGSGRWAQLVANKVGILHCIDASPSALAVARRNLGEHHNCHFHLASVDGLPIEDRTMDFGYSLGVLHHVPDTQSGINSCVAKLKPGAPFLLYLYYAFDNRPIWFKVIWRVSDVVRRLVSRMPFGLRSAASQLLAALVYWPLARGALLLEKCGLQNVGRLPLADYRKLSFYSMRTDALDRFGTRLEQRFTSEEIARMMRQAGLEKIRFSETVPYWTAVGFKAEN